MERSVCGEFLLFRSSEITVKLTRVAELDL